MAMGRLEVRLRSTTLLKASSLHNGDGLVPLTVFDRVSTDHMVANIFAFTPPVASNKVIMEGLSAALSYFPHLAGRLATDDRGRPCILLNNAGVRVVEATLLSTLHDVLAVEPSSISNLCDLHQTRDASAADRELVLVQLNHCACGGLLLAFSWDHRVADGQSCSSFFVAWSRLVRGLPLTTLPFHDRAAVLATRTPPRVLVNHLEREFGSMPLAPQRAEVDLVVLHFSGELVAQLKAKVMAGHPTRRSSTFRCLLTHLWKKMTMVRGLARDELTGAFVAVNGRSRLKPPVPAEYFGNLVLDAFPQMAAGELLERSYAEISDALWEAVEEMDDGYFRSLIDFGEVLRKEGLEGLLSQAPESNVMHPWVGAYSWLSFHIHELDMAGGPPLAFLMGPCNAVEGAMTFMPSCRRNNGGGGDVDVYIGVRRERSNGSFTASTIRELFPLRDLLVVKLLRMFLKSAINFGRL